VVKVVASNYIKAECVDEFLSVVKELVAKTNELDKGCVSYGLYQDTQDPLHYTMLEEWESEDCIGKHMQSVHATELIPRMVEFSSKPGDVAIYNEAVVYTA
jgi:quinol monooxygenase YgiN